LTKLNRKKRSIKKRARKATPFANTPPPLVGALKMKEAASYLSISTFTLTRLVQRGLIRANRTLRHYLFSRAELDRFLREGQV
jgi:excisionase family DNA binding protein